MGSYGKKAGRLNQHELQGEPNTQLQFPGGAYTIPPTIFDQLMDEGIEEPEHLKYLKHVAMFDFKCMFSQDQLPNNTDKLTWENKHEPLSVSVCSNIPSFQAPKCFITNGNSHQLIKEFF